MQLANTRAFIDNMRGFILRERGKFVSWPYLRLALRSCALWRFLFVFVLACRLRWPSTHAQLFPGGFRTQPTALIGFRTQPPEGPPTPPTILGLPQYEPEGDSEL